ncbi:bifunctional glutamate--cysteine ligase/glutathione synthetase [Sporanaerobium hydrogeniformans]|uniref:Bifunctional glutamate--cysteine ligase/glutathione synthetase n=2 Tax=Sporanaerobium hydrogeniformans TaxID=3072179 RepID=A0AC61DBA7_9FIRM|nr:bifunctional glutamate--cysteine ligase/glutathione synthetase [Sporanaerobium hydrogeniformans]
MLRQLKTLFIKEELLSGDFGIERESLRTTAQGTLALTNHPEVFGDKLTNPYITTDFSESQVELITPTFKTTKEVYDFLNGLYDITALEIGDEYLWPQSMPCDIPEDEHIPIAKYKNCRECEKARLYREELFKKYGGKKQLISGIHFNFSFEESFILRLYNAQSEEKDYKLYKNQLYLKIVRNYLRYRWLMIYLIGGAPIVHDTYNKECKKKLQKIGEDSYTNLGAISYRNGECGYQNQVDLFPDYTSITTYVKSIEDFVKQETIQSYKELYTQIRPKAKDNENLLESLEEEGIRYIEIRSIDINPFDKTGIALEDLEFLHLFMLYLLTKEETAYEKWQEEALFNQRQIAKEGLQNVKLKREGETIKSVEWAKTLLNEIQVLNEILGLGKEALVLQMLERVMQPEKTYAYRLLKRVEKEGYLQTHLALAKEYKKSAYANRYKLQGYEDMELSTQILMKEAIKRGIKVEVLDRADNFITLSKKNHIEYVKQATKTSKDSYMTMLMMENKVVTKKVLERQNICVPKGVEVTSKVQISLATKEFVNKPAVVKPKSTNFGTGISIFPEGASEGDLIDALHIGFEHDNTVLIEEFAKGKEYRFLVIDDQVVGILHRVPANVKGDGIHSIRELVALKNQDSLRGKGYKTPLEKIQLDESSSLFLKQAGLTFESVPQKDEVVYLRENSNISTGGDSMDYTDKIPQCFKQIAVQAAQAVSAKICGVDMMLEDYRDENTPYSVIELNFNPAIHIHCFPYKGEERNIAQHILKVLGFVD